MTPGARDKYSDLEEVTFRLFVVRDLDENDVEHERMKLRVHEWVLEIKEVNAAFERKLDKILWALIGLLITVAASLITAGVTNLLR